MLREIGKTAGRFASILAVAAALAVFGRAGSQRRIA